MSEIQIPGYETAKYSLVHTFSETFSRAYELHIHGGDYVKSFEQAELIAVQDPTDDNRYILGRPKIDAPPNGDIMFWLYTFQDRVPPQSYVMGELSMNVRLSDPSQLYVLSEGEFTPWGESKSAAVDDMLRRSQPFVLQ